MLDSRLTDITDSLYRVATRAVIIKDRKLLLLKEFDDDYWSTPGGGVDYGEKPLDALARELHEETGLKPSEYEVQEHPVLISQTLKGGIPRFNIYYKVTLISGEIRQAKDVEFFDWYTAEKFIETIDTTAADDARFIVQNLEV